MQTSVSAKDKPCSLSANLPERRYLPELHGVRGLALLGVVLFHLFGNGRTSGGIDIFLAVTGFLFTGMLLREAAASGGRVNLTHYFARLFRRIFFPAALVAVVTLVVALLVTPETQHRQLWAEARASLLYFENIELISSQLAYGAAGPDTSPFQHFWSLSVQGQFYLVWPLVAVIAVLLAKKMQVSAARTMAILSSIILVFSFGYAIYVGSYNQDEAYLMSTTRAWQLAFGAILALSISRIRLPQNLRWLGGWLGIAMIVTCGFVLDGADLFPGPWALWPLAGLTLVLISAGREGGGSDPTGYATRFLSNRSLAWVGDHAYGLYLWHWPLLIFYMEIRGREAIGLRGALVVLGATVVLAVLMHRYIEQPLQRAGRKSTSTGSRMKVDRRAIVAGVVLLGSFGVVASVLAPKPVSGNVEFSDVDQMVYPGAAQFFSSAPLPEAEPFPPLDEIAEHKAEYTTRSCTQQHGEGPRRDQVLICEDESAPVNPSATIALVGGSHAGHLEAAFKNLGSKYGWEVLVVTKSRCDFGIEETVDGTMCGAWSENVVNWLSETDVDLVVTPGTRLDQAEHILDLAPVWWNRISGTNTDLLLVRGMPRGSNVPECLAEGGTSEECGMPKDRFAETNPLLSVELPANAYQVDVSPYLCPSIDDPTRTTCDAIVGNIIVSYDTNHLTRPFSASLAGAFEVEMQDDLPHLFR